MKVTKLLDIARGWRNGCLSRKELVVMYFFVWSPIQKSRSLLHRLMHSKTMEAAFIAWTSTSRSLNKLRFFGWRKDSQCLYKHSVGNCRFENVKFCTKTCKVSPGDVAQDWDQAHAWPTLENPIYFVLSQQINEIHPCESSYRYFEI